MFLIKLPSRLSHLLIFDSYSRRALDSTLACVLRGEILRHYFIVYHFSDSSSITYLCDSTFKISFTSKKTWNVKKLYERMQSVLSNATSEYNKKCATLSDTF